MSTTGGDDVPGRLAFRPPAAPPPGGWGPAEPFDGPLGIAEPGGGRDGVLYVPDTAEAGAPVLVFLHGATGSGRTHLRAVLAAADRYGVVVVAPDSRGGSTWDVIAERRFGPDVVALDRAVAVAAERNVGDLTRLAIGGVSDGASYALSIGLTNGDVFGHVIAFSPGFIAVAEAAGHPRVFVSHGTADPILPIDACSRQLVAGMRSAGFDVTYEEFDGGHTVPPPTSDRALAWWLAPAV